MTDIDVVIKVRATFSGAASGEPEALKEAFKAFLESLGEDEEADATGSIVISGESFNEADLLAEEEEAPAPAPAPATTSTKTTTKSEG